MRSKEVKNAIEEIEHLKSFGTSGIAPRWATIDILLDYIEKLEKEEDRDYTTIYLKGVADKDGVWRDKIRDKIKELEKQLQEYEESDIEEDEDYLFDTNAIRSTIEVLKSMIGE